MIGVASADVLPNLRNAKQLSDLDVEVFSPKIMRFGIMDQLLYHSGPENLKKSQAKKKLVKLHFWQFKFFPNSKIDF